VDFFLQATSAKKVIAQVRIMKKQIVIVKQAEKQAMSILPYEAKYTLLELFCHQPNMTG